MTPEEQAAADAAVQQQAAAAEKAALENKDNDFNWEATTGGRIKTKEELPQFFEQFETNFVPASKLEEFKGFISEKDAYANPFVKEVNTLLKSNASPDAVKLFIDLSLSDVDKMDSREAIAKSRALSEGTTFQSASVLVKDEFPTFEDYMEANNVNPEVKEDVDKAKAKYSVIEAKLEREFNLAKKSIAEKKKEVFEGIESKEATETKQREAYEGLKQTWSTNKDLETAVVTGLKSFDFTHKTKDGVEYSLSIPTEEKVVKDLYNQAIQYAIKSGLQPTKESVEHIVETLQDYYFSRNKNAFVGSLYEDIRSKVVKEITDKEKGEGIKREGEGGGEEGKGRGFYG